MTARSQMEPGAETTQDRGVWIVYYYDVGPVVESVHATELEALRQINHGMSMRVAFVPFGAEVQALL